MKRLATIGAVGTIMMLSVTPITIAHADPIDNDTLTITVNGVVTKCLLGANGTTVDDGTTAAETRCNFPAGFDPPKRGRVQLTDIGDTASISDILWTHDDGSTPDHFHYISDPTVTFMAGHRGDFNTLLGTLDEIAGPIDVSDLFGFAANSGITVVITSDVVDSAPDPVPEPATLSLLVVGLAGLGYLLRQRKL